MAVDVQWKYLLALTQHCYWVQVPHETAKNQTEKNQIFQRAANRIQIIIFNLNKSLLSD